MTPGVFGDLFQIVVDTIYFIFNGQIYKQTYDMDMGFWGRYVDDTRVVI